MARVLADTFASALQRRLFDMPSVAPTDQTSAPNNPAAPGSAIAQTPAPTALQALLGQLNDALLGKTAVVHRLAAALLAKGHVLLIDSPGVGKTTLAKAVAASLDMSFGRVQGTSDLLPTDLTGVTIFDQPTGEWRYRPGPLVNGVVLVDEVNRIPPRSQSALLEAMAEGQISVDGESQPVQDPFMVIATANPLGQQGTFPLVEGLLDRFAVSLSLGLPGREFEHALLTNGSMPTTSLRPCLTAEGFVALQDQVAAQYIAPQVVDYVLNVVTAARQAAWLSPRASQAVLATAKAWAFLGARNHVTPDDVKAVAPMVLAHRLSSAQGDWEAATAAVQHVLTAVPAPRPGS